MGRQSGRSWRRAAWEQARRQHWVISRRQLLELGASRNAIDHRLATARLHPLFRGVYSVGRPGPGPLGRLMAATLAAGEGALVSHRSAAHLWGLMRGVSPPVHVSVPGSGGLRKRAGLVVHRRAAELLAPEHARLVAGIPVTSPGATIIDIAAGLSLEMLDSVVSEADKQDLLDPAGLRRLALAEPRRPGSRRVRRGLDRHAFVLSDSALERIFARLALRAGLGKPATRTFLNSHRVDFWFESIGLVVETDGLRYHRTPGQQSRDLRRDQDHAAAGQERLRFSHWQVRYEPGRVVEVLEAVAARLLR